MTTTAPASATSPEQQEEHPPKRRLFTVEEFYALDQAGLFHSEERIELLDGEIIVMAPIGNPHADGTDRLDESLKEKLRGRARVRVQGPVRINENSLLQPDIAVLHLRDDYHRVAPTPADVLLLVEVADTSLEFDREVKLARYAAAGIHEVWIVNLRSRQVEAHADPVDGTYRSRRVVTADGSISPVAFPDVFLVVGEFLLA